MILTGKKIVISGDSIGAGAAATSVRWSTQVCNHFVAIEENNSIGGRLLQSPTCGGRNVWTASLTPIWDASYGLNILTLTTNDITNHNAEGKGYSVLGAQNKIQEWYEDAISKGWEKERLLIVTAGYFTNYSIEVGSICGITEATKSNVTIHEAYVVGLKSKAQSLGIECIDMYASMKADTNPALFLSGDGLHPNQSGHDFMANVYKTTIAAMSEPAQPPTQVVVNVDDIPFFAFFE